jgi:hypothetical protein
MYRKLALSIIACLMLFSIIASISAYGNVAPGTRAESARHSETINAATVSMRSVPLDFDAQTPKPIRRIKHHPRPFRVDEDYIQQLREEGQIKGKDIARQDPGALDRSKANGIDGVPCRSYNGINSTGWNPPDPHAAVGIDHVVAVVNSSIAIFHKESGSPLYQVTASSFFAPVSPPSTFIFDPKVVYDPFEDRFIILFLCTDDVSQASFLVAVSKTGDAMGDWWLYDLDATLTGEIPADVWPDYPGLGFDHSDAVYVTSNDWGFSTGYQFAKIRILKKAELYTGAISGWYDFWRMRYNNNETAFTVKPAVTLSDAGCEYFLSNIWYGSNYTTYWKVTDAGTDTPVIELMPQVNLSAPYTGPPNPTQPHTSTTLQAIGPMTQEIFFRNEKLYTTFSQSFNWGSGYVASLRLIGIDVATANPFLNEIYGADGKHYFFPAIATDYRDRIYLTFSVSSSEDFPSVFFVDAYEKDNTAHGLRIGLDYFGSGGSTRWGDYCGIAVDPSQKSVWMFHEWATASHAWSTWIGQVPGEPSEPGHLSPADSELVPLPNIVLEWEDFQVIDSFIVEIDNNSNFASPEIIDTVEEATYTASGSAMISGYPQYWRLMATNDCGATPYTSAWSFIPCGEMHGNADGNTFIDIDDVVFIIQYIFVGGPEPDPSWQGDADCNGETDIDDVVYIIEYIFSGGPQPCGGC